MREAVVKVFTVLAPMQSHIVNIIHDEIMIDAAESEIPIIVEHIPNMMRPKRINKIIPIDVDCEYSDTTWADKKEYGLAIT
jgi:DNA polymerase I-like protein with 3'-5' exonuclease and polymerase domains